MTSTPARASLLTPGRKRAAAASHDPITPGTSKTPEPPTQTDDPKTLGWRKQLGPPPRFGETI